MICSAPMEGLTGSAYRRAHHACFEGVQAYYMPFITPSQNLTISSRELRDILPENNTGVPCVPQVLTKDAAQFLWAASTLADMGYTEVNLNAGCPSGTVTAKGKGSGLLADTDSFERFLDGIFDKCRLPVSIKTRIGYQSAEEWLGILEVYARYPLKRLIIHPRTGKDFYKPATLHTDCWETACKQLPYELIWNGDVFTPADAAHLPSGMMLGRGLLANPALARILSGGRQLQREELVRFYERLVLEHTQHAQPDAALTKLKAMLQYLICCFENTSRIEKLIRKSRDLSQLSDVSARLFESCPMKAEPAFVPESLRSRPTIIL